jgi:citronellyl-CoA synthetase
MRLPSVFVNQTKKGKKMGQRAPNGSDGLITLTDILKGVIPLLPRLPSMITNMRAALKLHNDQERSFTEFLEANAKRYGHKTAIRFEDKHYTHDQLNRWINRYAHFLMAEGVRKGDTVVVLLENRPEIMMVIGAVGKIGAVAALINTRQRRAALLHSLRLTPGLVYLVGEELVGQFEEVRADLSMPEQARCYFLPDRGKQRMPDGYIDGFDRLKDHSDRNPSPRPSIRLKDPFAFIFTSGTTGLPKAAYITHIQMVSSIIWMGRVLTNLNSRDTLYITLPFVHSNAIKVGWASAIAGGAAVALRRKFSAGNFWKDVRTYDVTAFSYIGELCRYLLAQEPSPDDRKNRVRKIVGNGLRKEIWRDFQKRFAIPIVYEFYGATEIMLAFCNLLNIPGTMGLCLDHYAIVQYDPESSLPIRDRSGRFIRVARGETGLLLGRIRAHVPFAGYTDPAANQKKVLSDCFEPGDVWVNTGDLVKDLGYRHARFVDRLGDTFRWKGENVSTTEVEEVINRCEGVNACSVYGVHLENTDGKAGMAAIVTTQDAAAFDFSNLLMVLKSNLPDYAIPLLIRLKKELETTSTFKIKKVTLKAEGFNPDIISDPLFVLLPGESAYRALDRTVYAEMEDGKYRF